MARRLFVCVVCAFRGNRFNIERHVWIRHVRGTIPGMQEEPYNAAYKEQVLKYLQVRTFFCVLTPCLRTGDLGKTY